MNILDNIKIFDRHDSDDIFDSSQLSQLERSQDRASRVVKRKLENLVGNNDEESQKAKLLLIFARKILSRDLSSYYASNTPFEYLLENVLKKDAQTKVNSELPILVNMFYFLERNRKSKQNFNIVLFNGYIDRNAKYRVLVEIPSGFENKSDETRYFYLSVSTPCVQIAITDYLNRAPVETNQLSYKLANFHLVELNRNLLPKDFLNKSNRIVEHQDDNSFLSGVKSIFNFSSFFQQNTGEKKYKYDFNPILGKAGIRETVSFNSRNGYVAESVKIKTNDEAIAYIISATVGLFVNEPYFYEITLAKKYLLKLSHEKDFYFFKTVFRHITNFFSFSLNFIKNLFRPFVR